MPRVKAKTIDRLIETFEKASPEPRAVVPHYKGRRGNPVLLGRAIFREAMAPRATGARGACSRKTEREFSPVTSTTTVSRSMSIRAPISPRLPDRWDDGA